jgi:hypothetical protein
LIETSQPKAKKAKRAKKERETHVRPVPVYADTVEKRANQVLLIVPAWIPRVDWNAESHDDTFAK